MGVLASEHWQHKLPNFNIPEKKGELEQFAKKIIDKCSQPEAGVFTGGIAQHIESFFSEQRRFHKNKRKVPGLLLIHIYLHFNLFRVKFSKFAWLAFHTTLPDFERQ